MQARCYSGKDWATLSLSVTANRDDISKKWPRFLDIDDFLRVLLREFDPDFLHCLHNQRIDLASLETGALSLEYFTANIVEPCLSHLTAGTVVNADEQNFLFHI